MYKTKDFFTASILLHVESIPSLEADSHSASQDIPRLLWNSRTHYRLHNSMPLVLILSQIHLVHNSPHYFP